jgi:hypothetical protein
MADLGNEHSGSVSIAANQEPYMTSLAQEFFNQIKTAQPSAVSFLKGLICSNPPTFEGEWLDFKGNPQNDDDLKSHWSKSLSAFSNTEGGVLIWGIDARQDPVTKVDAAHDLNLIPNTSQLKSRLNQLLHEATNPPMMGVEIEEFPDPAEGGKGFVVCLIPESEQKPVQAELVKNKPYYHRSGDSSKFINRALLRSLFFPHARSRLTIHVAFDRVGFGDEPRIGQFAISIHNHGPSTANDIFAKLTADPRFPFSECAGLGNINTGEGDQHASQTSLHPGMSCRLFLVKIPKIAQATGLTMTLTIYARDRDAECRDISVGYFTLRGQHDEFEVK